MSKTYVYDKGSWYYEGDFPEDLEPEQGFTHIAMIVHWLVDNDFLSEENKTDFLQEIQDLKSGKMTSSEFCAQTMDECLLSDEFTAEAKDFLDAYYEDIYSQDYENCLASDLETIYHVEDNLENYNKLKQVLDKRFQQWKNGQGFVDDVTEKDNQDNGMGENNTVKKQWWQFWK